MHNELFAEIPSVLTVKLCVAYIRSGQYPALQTIFSSLSSTWTT